MLRKSELDAELSENLLIQHNYIKTNYILKSCLLTMSHLGFFSVGVYIGYIYNHCDGSNIF